MVGAFEAQLLEPAHVDVFAQRVGIGIGIGSRRDAVPAHGDPAERDRDRHLPRIAEVGEFRPRVDQLQGSQVSNRVFLSR
jgi:hypothetical protein